MHTSIGPQRCHCAPPNSHDGSNVPTNRPATALHATAAPSRYAAEETARKAAAVREQLKHQSSRYAKQIHEQNAHIAELQQQASRRAQQQAELQKLLASEEAEVQQQEHWVQDEELQEQLQQMVEQLSGPVQQQQDRPRLFSDSDQSRYDTFRQGGGSMQQQPFEAMVQDPQQQYQQQQRQQQHQEGFPKLLQEVEVLARSSDYRDCQKGGCSCPCRDPAPGTHIHM